MLPIEKLAKLINENPTLPIVPMVYKHSDDNCSCVIGSVINCEIAEYTIYKNQMYDNKDDFLEAYLNNNEEDLEHKFKGNADDINSYIKQLMKNEFKKAIIVTIDISN